MSIVTGSGNFRVARDLYEIAVLREVVVMRREGVYVCFANIMARMPSYNQQILWDLCWTMALEGKLS
jgi:hypothetical protein